MKQILNSFIERVIQGKLRLHGVIIYQNDSVMVEHYFTPDIPRSIYSVSKSFMVTAIGQLLDDGLISLSDRPIDYFPDNLPNKLHSDYEKLELSHLLKMSSGHDRPLLHWEERAIIKETDWIRFVLSQPLISKPGEKFLYSNGSAYLAGCMAEKATGVKLVDYLYETLFQPLDIPYPVWDECPMGHTFAASTLQLRLSDMIKLGIVYLNNGYYNGKRIVSKQWIDTATSYKISSHQISIKGTGEDEKYGYGYQFWLCRFPGVFRLFGRRGQFVIVLPEYNAVIGTSAYEDNEQSILDAIWETILPRLKD